MLHGGPRLPPPPLPPNEPHLLIVGLAEHLFWGHVDERPRRRKTQWQANRAKQ